jgi:Ca2+:H+ antiporter
MLPGLVLVPVSLLLAYVFHAPAVWVFASALLAIVPLADLIRRATEQVARRAGPAAGGLLNVTFGNLAELVLAFFVLAAGHEVVVKGQITGSIIGNALLGLGMAVVAGSLAGKPLRFGRERAGVLASLLVLCMVALLLPALFDYTERGIYHEPDAGAREEHLSLAVSVVLILVYAANLVYTLRTRRDVFARPAGGEPEAPPPWPLARSLAVLAGAAAVTALEADLASGALEASATRLGLTPFFLGVTVLAVVGNASEYVSAVYFARRGQMGMVMSITMGSTLQVALLVAPLLVIGSYLLGRPMDLVFANPLELAAIAAVSLIVKSVTADGETTWIEGVLLLAVYAVLALAFFFVRP